MKLCSLGISCEIYSLSHLFIKQRQPKKLGEVLLCWMQLWEFPLSFSSGFLVFLAGDQSHLSPSPFHISAAELNVSWHKLGLPRSFPPHCWGLLWRLPDAVSDHCSLWQKISTNRAFAGINYQFASCEDLPLVWSLKGGTSVHFWCTVSPWEVWAAISAFPLIII